MQQTSSAALMLPGPALKTYAFERTEIIGTLTLPAADQGYTWSWTLADLPSVTEFTALFQEYKVTLITLTLTWNAASGSTSVAYPHVFAVDTSSGVTPSGTLAAHMQYPYRKYVFNQSKTEHSFSVRPCVRMGADVSGTLSGRVVAKCPWLATSGTNVNLSGIAAWIANYNTTLGTGTLTATARVKFLCRGLL